VSFVQGSRSKLGDSVLRGRYYRIQTSQRKLVGMLRGEVFDVTMDPTKSSDTFGQRAARRFRAQNDRQPRVRQGFAHSFVAGSIRFLHKTPEYYPKEHACSLLSNEQILGIQLLFEGEPRFANKDASAPSRAKTGTSAGCKTSPLFRARLVRARRVTKTL
jgi:dTDP-4-dehydrorhamnose 3,5-epimerase